MPGIRTPSRIAVLEWIVERLDGRGPSSSTGRSLIRRYPLASKSWRNLQGRCVDATIRPKAAYLSTYSCSRYKSVGLGYPSTFWESGYAFGSWHLNLSLRAAPPGRVEVGAPLRYPQQFQSPINLSSQSCVAGMPGQCIGWKSVCASYPHYWMSSE